MTIDALTILNVKIQYLVRTSLLASREDDEIEQYKYDPFIRGRQYVLAIVSWSKVKLNNRTSMYLAYSPHVVDGERLFQRSLRILMSATMSAIATQ